MPSLHNKVSDVEQRIQSALCQRESNGRLRKLSSFELPVDFSSNDYLGLSRSAWMQKKIEDFNLTHPAIGSTGSRLLSGNNELAEETEQILAEFFRAETALVYNSGYDANTGLISTVIRPNDFVLFDKAIHASMHQGIKLSGAESKSFSHNDLEDLEEKMANVRSEVSKWLLIESYYSMDGDQAPLKEMCQLAEQYQFNIIIDEAHAVGCFGPNGRGLVAEHNLENRIFARVVTFGKGLGVHGAAVLGSSDLKKYLINFSKAFIYTTALPPHSFYSIQAGIDFLKHFPRAQSRLQKNIEYFEEKCLHFKQISGTGPVFSFVIPGEIAVKDAAKQLQAQGIDVRAIVAPMVEKGKERLRINIHSFNTPDEIDLLTNLLETFS